MARWFLVLILLADLAAAEPSPTVSRLMDEPASMFDMGMLRLRYENNVSWIPRLKERLTETSVLSKGESVDRGAVVYNIKENRINIEVTITGRIDESRCARVLREYKDAISPLRIRSANFAAVLFAGSFDHVNYSVRGAPRDWHREIVSIVRVSVAFKEPLPPPEPGTSAEYNALRSLDGNKTLFCNGSLEADDVAYSKSF